MFVDSPPLRRPNSSRNLNTTSSIDREQELALHSEAEDSYVLAESSQFTTSDLTYAPSVPPSSSGDDGSEWDPSAVSQESAAEVTNNEEILTKSEPEEEPPNEDSNGEYIPLTFRIPKDVLQKAKDAEPGTKESFWTYKMFLGPDNQEVKVHYCRSKHTTERVAQYFLDEKVIGFDIEWKAESTRNSGIKKNVSLIQIASETRIGLFHIAAFPNNTVEDLVAPTLKKIMEDPEITKVGVAIKADCTRLRNFLEIDPRGIFELSHLYKLVRYSSSGEFGQINKRLVSVATQADEHLDLPIFKGEVRGSDWSQALGMEQIVCQCSSP